MGNENMKINSLRGIFFSIVAIFISCASSKAHFDFAQATSKPGLNMHSARLGVMPLQCYASDVGNIISDTIANNLSASGIEVIERTRLAKTLEEHKFDLAYAMGDLGYSTIGDICNVDYLLVGIVSTLTYSKRFIREKGVVLNNVVVGAKVRIVSVATGEVVARANIKRTRRNKWHQPVIVGQALAAAITKALEEEK